ncbi:Sec-independent protein translocase protein TatA [Tenacibaculum sediminilitoris]|uniref:Sec-independent protein translocase subunit TatA/TatB n=1 Tax=Tenacibaculum sediminilitoris TaxID=1820334 RepID=UPI0038955688
MNLLTIFLGMVGPWQIAIVVALVLLLFGGRKIPELMRGLGTGIKEFKDATKNEDEESENDSKVEEKK